MSDLFSKFVQRIREKGIARNHFYMRMDVNDIFFSRKVTTDRRGTWFPSDEGASDKNLFSNERLKSIGVMCNSVTLPGRELEIMEEIIKPGIKNKIVSNLQAPDEITAKFYCSPDLNERRFIENWMNMAVNPITRDANYYDEYAKFNTITIFSVPRAFSGTTINEEVALQNGPMYFVKLYECYPYKVEETTLEYGNAENIFELTVGFKYKYFETITDIYFPSVSDGYSRQWEQSVG